jgi:deazaflavin-dependent oxidoreductase (nitroreductase family)
VSKEERLTFNQRNIAEFRSNGGRIASFGDAPVLLLTAPGAKSRLPRTNPMMYLADEDQQDRVYVFASAAGADTNPDWFHNLLAHPNDLTVEIGDDNLTADAEVLPEPLREQVYAVQASRYPGFASYQAKTSRAIPVVALTLHRGRRHKR